MTTQELRCCQQNARRQRTLYATGKRVALLALASIGVMAGLANWAVVSGHDIPETKLFTVGVGDQGSTTAFWAPGTDVRTIPVDDLKDCEACRVEILLPEEFADAIRRTFENLDDYENVELPKVLRIVVVIGGSAARVCDVHWHGPFQHDHCN